MTEPIIKVKNLTKKFGDVTAVDNISFEVKPGELFAFLGPNGAGKTTTVSMLTTISMPTSGTIAIAGLNPATQADLVRTQFGIVFQDSSHDEDLTAYENLLYHAILFNVPKVEREVRIKALLEQVDLWDKKDKLVKTFSGGMKRRMEIARGLIHQPKILFLDEPTLGLDPQTRKYMWEKITQMRDTLGMTVFFSTHYMEEAEKYADRICIIDKGVIQKIGTVAELTSHTQTQTLEEAFLKLTGHTIRDESVKDGLAAMRNRRSIR